MVDFPEELFTSRISMTFAWAGRENSGFFCLGCTLNRTYRIPSFSNSSIPLACSDEERAPLSTLALMRDIPRSGIATHSRQPMIGKPRDSFLFNFDFHLSRKFPSSFNSLLGSTFSQQVELSLQLLWLCRLQHSQLEFKGYFWFLTRLDSQARLQCELPTSFYF